MKNKIKVFIAVIFAFVMIFNTNIFAASVNISANTSVEIGNNVTISISVPGVSGKCTVTSSNPGVVALSTGSIWIEKGATSPIVGYTKGVGSATITVTPSTMADDISGEDLNVAAKSITITVKEKYVPPVQNNTNTNTNTNTNNNANTNQNTNNNAGANTNTTNKATNNNTTTKSSNAYLSKLQVNVEGLTPNFNKNKYSYTLAVGENVDSINVTAIAENSKAKVAVTGNNDLKAGDNTISIVVTAQDGTKKTYTIVATKSADPIKSDSYLANLIIEDCVLSPEFSSEVFEYDLGTIALDKLNIYAYPKNENANVEITGHETLVDGENIIKIKITSEDETTTKEYTLKVNKDPNAIAENVEVNALVEEENIVEPSRWEKLKKLLLENWLVVLLFIFVVVEFVEILYLYCKYHKVKVTLPWKNYDEEKDDKNDSWFKKLNKDNDDFSEKTLEKNEDEIKVNDTQDNEKIDEVLNEEKEEQETQDEVSYEEIMSKINELGNRIDEGIQTDTNVSEEIENKETKIRNGRNGRID